MIPWIQVYSNLIRHPKVTKLADKLELSSKDVGANVIAAGMIVSLWLWAAQNATDGNLSECSDRAIAEAAEYKKKPSVFVEALKYAKFLDDDKRLHDWDEYATLLIEYEDQQREKTRQRVARHRAKKKAMSVEPGNDECNAECNVTVTQGNASTKPNLTLPNNTLHSSAMCASDSLFESFWEAYPKQVDKPAALSAWTELAMSEREKKELLLHLDDWKKSEQWAEAGGRFVPKPSNFLDRNQIYLCTIPKPAKQPIPKGASGVLGDAEMEAIRRVLDAEVAGI